MARTTCTAALILLAGGTAAAQELEEPPGGRDVLQDVSRFHPLLIEDADPAPPGLVLRASAGRGELEGGEAIAFRQQIEWGIHERFSLQVASELTEEDGAGEFGPTDLAAFLQLVEGERLVPSFGVEGTLLLDEGGEQTGLAAAGNFGWGLTRATRVLANVRYTGYREEENEYLLVLGADWRVVERLLVGVDLYHQRPHEEPGAYGGDAGLRIRLGRAFLLEGAVGFTHVGEETEPRFVIGASSHL